MKEKKDKECCYWYKSISIEKNNPRYEQCRINCNGYDKDCDFYVSKNTLEKRLLQW